MICLPRPILFALELTCGDYVEMIQQEDGAYRLTRFGQSGNVALQSPGVLLDKPRPGQL